MAGTFLQSLPHSSLASRLTVATLAVGCAALLRIVLTPVWGATQVPFVFFFPAVVVATWLGRFWAGVFATVLGGVVASWLFLPPHRTWALPGPEELLTLALYAAGCLCIAAAIEAMHRANARAVAELTERRLAEQRVQQREEQLRSVTDHAPIWIIQVDNQARYLFANAPYAASFGTTPGELIGRSLADVLGAANFELIRPHVQAALAGEKVEFELRLTHPTQGPRHLRAAYVPQTTATGIVSSFVAIVQDVTQSVEAAQAVRETENRIRHLADSLPQLVWTATGDGRVDYYNSRASEYRGFERSTASEWKWQPVLHPDDLHATIVAWQHAVNTGETYEIEHRVAMADGSYRWHLSRAIAVRDDQGRVIRWFGTATDIHAQWQAQAELRDSQERLQLALAGARMGVWSWDVTTNAVTWSPELRDLMGLEHLSGTLADFERLVHPDDWPSTQAELRSAMAGHRDYLHEFRILRADGAVRWMAGRGRAINDASGQPQRLFGVVMDITERKQAELQLEAARDEALAANRAKDDFLAMLSHELRTPLNPVLLTASEAADDPSLPESVRATFELIASNVSLEARLIDDLLDLNRIVQGKAALECMPLDLHAVLRAAVQTVQPEIEHKQLQVTFALDAADSTVFGDPVRLRQVIWNVLRNAVKFTPPGGLIAIDSSNTPPGERVQVCIRDSGIGMKAEEVGRVFEPFVQGDHAIQKGDTTYGGLGVGLAISRTLVERHAGSIRAESAGRGHGTTIVISLPLAESAPATNASAPRSVLEEGTVHPQIPHRVLVVDDHEPTLKTLSAVLQRRGYLVTSANSMEQARQFAAGAEFDLLVSDLGLPDGDGCTLMRELRMRQPHLAGIAISGYGMDADLEQSTAAGFRDHLTKPISVSALERALASIPPPPGTNQNGTTAAAR